MNTFGQCRCSPWIMSFTAWEPRFLWFNKLWNLSSWQSSQNQGLPSILIKPRASKAVSILNYWSIPVAAGDRGSSGRSSFPPLTAIPTLPWEHHSQHGILDHLWTAKIQLRGGSFSVSLWLLKQTERCEWNTQWFSSWECNQAFLEQALTVKLARPQSCSGWFCSLCSSQKSSATQLVW